MEVYAIKVDIVRYFRTCGWNNLDMKVIYQYSLKMLSEMYEFPEDISARINKYLEENPE